MSVVREEEKEQDLRLHEVVVDDVEYKHIESGFKSFHIIEQGQGFQIGDVVKIVREEDIEGVETVSSEITEGKLEGNDEVVVDADNCSSDCSCQKERSFEKLLKKEGVYRTITYIDLEAKGLKEGYMLVGLGFICLSTIQEMVNGL